MILSISIKNYRSFKEETIFSLEAESSPRSKEENYFTQSLAKGDDEVRILKTAMIFGANASGKSNLFRAIFEITKFIGKNRPNVGESIPVYDPFLFSSETKEAPIEFKIEFVGKDDIKYRYQLAFDKKNVINESLIYFPNKKETILFTRLSSENIESITHIGKLGSSLKNKEIEVFHNRALLSKFGDEIPNEIISKVYIYLTKIDVVNATNLRRISNLFNETREKMDNDSNLFNKMNELLRFADTGLNGINIRDRADKEFILPKDISDESKREIINENKYLLTGKHSFYNNSILVKNDAPLPFEQESRGTNTIFALGGRLIQALEYGEILFVDEIETNLHPYLSKFLVCLFQSERINKHNSQLIFTTHNPILLDRSLFRKDQVWFTEKDEFGASNLYSLKDFTDVREDTPFDKWYLAGKFGGIPNIKSLEALFI
jgi:hypothetical protein